MSSHSSATPGFTYRVLGLCLHSEFELPELRQVTNETGAADIVIRKGRVPPAADPPDADLERAPYRATPEGFFLDRKGVGRFRVSDGDTVTVDACPEVAEVDVRVYLLGSVFGALCHQRGLLPLHAAAVTHEGEGFAFSGPSGTGKSTISAGLCERGFGFVADDVCPIAFSDRGDPRILDGVLKVKLSADTLRALGHTAEGQVCDHQDAPRYHVPVSHRAPSFPVPLRRVYMFRNVDNVAAPRIEEISAAYAVRCFQNLTYMPRYLIEAGQAADHFLRCASLAEKVRLFEVYYRRGLDRLPDLLARLSDHLLGHGTSKTA